MQLRPLDRNTRHSYVITVWLISLSILVDRFVWDFAGGIVTSMASGAAGALTFLLVMDALTRPKSVKPFIPPQRDGDDS